MTSTSSNSGAGSRPTTSGTVDNIGAGEALKPGSRDTGPAPHERMQDRRHDAESSSRDDSAPLGMTEHSPAAPEEEKHEGAARGNESEVVEGGGSMAGPGPAGSGAGAPAPITAHAAAVADRGAAEAARDAQKKKPDSAA